MDQHIQYAVTEDGYNIAYSTVGSGPVLISVPSPPDNHLQLEWEDPLRRRHLEHIASYRTLVRFDPRGAGLSDRGVTGYSLETRLRDLEAVIWRLGVPSVALMSGSHGNQVAAAYAAHHPEHVSHFIAIQPFVSGREFLSEEKVALMDQILRQNFELFTQNVGAMVFGWGSEQGPRYSSFFKQCVTQADAITIYSAMLDENIGPLLRGIQCPTLVINCSGTEDDVLATASARRFAAAVPGATMAVVNSPPSETGSPALVRRTGEFFGEVWEAPEPEIAPPANGVLRTILFTDIVHHTQMMDRLGDQAGRQVLRDHERITRETLRRFQGHEVKTVGDSFMASFESVTQALHCASALQRAFAARNEGAATPIEIRIGVNAGEPIAEDDDLFGASVIAAARIKDQAGAGQIHVANVVRELVAGKGFLFADLGEQILRGLEDAVRVYELRWE